MSEGRLAQRPILFNALRRLVAEARAERVLLPLSSRERQFYLGVEAAADDLLHPETATARAEHWLDAEAPEFRDGYLRTSALLAAAAAAEDPPLRLPLPRFDSR